jgi:hypothetical protein
MCVKCATSSTRSARNASDVSDTTTIDGITTTGAFAEATHRVALRTLLSPPHHQRRQHSTATATSDQSVFEDVQVGWLQAFRSKLHALKTKTGNGMALIPNTCLHGTGKHVAYPKLTSPRHSRHQSTRVTTALTSPRHSRHHGTNVTTALTSPQYLRHHGTRVTTALTSSRHSRLHNTYKHAEATTEPN